MEFREITFEEIPVMRKYLSKNDNKGCEFSLANSFMWNVDCKYKYTIWKEQIVYRCTCEKYSIYATPSVRKDSADFIADLMEDAKKAGKGFQMTGLSEEMKSTLEELFPGRFEFEYNRDNSDYIYLVEDLSTLKGKKLHAKRNHINFFLSNYQYVYEELNEQNIAECKVMKTEWSEQNDSDAASLETELKAVDTALDHLKELGLVGGLIRIDGEVKAFTVGERLTEDTFVTHIEKADYNIRGLYPMINQQFALHQLQGYKYVNREEDLGVEGLRKAKLSYQPEMIWDKYKAFLKD